MEKTAGEIVNSRMDATIVRRGRVVVIGAGGVGSALLEPLCVFLANLVQDEVPIEVVIVDGDDFSPSNAYRVAIPDYKNKAQAWCEKLSNMFYPEQLLFYPIQKYVTPNNLEKVIQDGDCVMLCLDNHKSRKVISDYCNRLGNVVVISGGNDGVNEHQDGTGGTVQVHCRKRVEMDQVVTSGSPLDLFHPEIGHPADKSPDELDCTELAAAGEPQLSFANLAVASCMCNVLLRIMMQPKRPLFDEVAFDIKENKCVPQYLTVPDPQSERS